MSDGPAGLRYNVNVAFSTAYGILDQAEKVTDRRKAFLYVSSGYDLNPFKDSRYKVEQERYALPSDTEDPSNRRGEPSPFDNPFDKGGLQFAESDLIAQMAELIRAANRANVTFYTVDPRGLMAGPDINLDLGAREWQDYLNNTISSLKVLAQETGGICVCNTNDFRRYLQQIDNEMSDYYLLGWTTSNPDPLKITRRVEIKVSRPAVRDLIYRPEYRLERPNRRKSGG
jgi:VWFA-related protein